MFSSTFLLKRNATMSTKSEDVAARRAKLGLTVISNDGVTTTARTGSLTSVKDSGTAPAAGTALVVAAAPAPAAPKCGEPIDTSIAYRNHCGPDARSASFRSSPSYAAGQMPTPNSIGSSSPARVNPMRARLSVVGSDQD